MHTDDTIVAIATPAGRGGIGVVRLSGPEAQKIALPLLRLRSALQTGRVQFCELVDPADASKLDEVVVTYFAAPHSYTTDDIIEISAHGSPVLLRWIVEQSLTAGARLAEPGEFTLRAFLHGRLDLTQAEAVKDLIEAQTLTQAKVAAQQLDGALSRRIHPIKEKLIALIARLEAGVDFAEDDISVAPESEILRSIDTVLAPLRELEASFAYGRIVHEGLTLAIVGRPNVGKSSLFNRLVERERAIVTAIPGTTRDMVTETVTLGDIPVKLMDTAGIRATLDEAERLGVAKSYEAMADADLVLLVLDASAKQQSEDEHLLQLIGSRPVIVVENKCDLSRMNKGDEEYIRTSAVTGEGIPELREKILARFTQGLPEMEQGFLTNVRHHEAVKKSIAALERAGHSTKQRIPHEMLLLDVYVTLSELDEISGKTSADDILNKIFGSFCIGK